jgi:hypothetical protein
MTLKVTDRWTTQNGSWDVNPAKPFGIDQAHRDKYEAGKNIPGAGADHHIMVYAPFAHIVEFSSDSDVWYPGAVKDGWWNFPIFKDAFYDPDKNEVGTWHVRIEYEKLATEGIGLPKGEHVSTFLVVEDVDSGSQPDTPSTPPSTVSHIQVLVNGVVKSEFWI